MNDYYSDMFYHDNSMCDCCGVTIDDHEIHTIENICEVSLCRRCILQLYALLDRDGKNGIIRVLPINKEGKNHENSSVD